MDDEFDFSDDDEINVPTKKSHVIAVKPSQIISPKKIATIAVNHEIFEIIPNLYLGDIIISYNFMNKNTNKEIKLFKDKVIKIFIHGFLHLLGFDHAKLKSYNSMFREEKKIYQSVIKKTY